MNGEQQQPKKKRTWLWIVLGVFMFFVIVAAGGLFFAVSFFRQSMEVMPMSASSAEQEFDAVRARFAGKQPLFQLVDDRAQMVSDPSAKPAAAAPDAVHLLAWDEDEEQLVKFSIPFWLLRLKSGPIRISAYAADFNDRGLSFTVEDLERYGPGLLLDLPHQRDGRVLIWAE